MPELTFSQPDAAQRKLDRQLLLGLMLPPVGAGMNTIVGFMVAHWIAIVAYKRTGYLVAIFSFALCAAGAVLAQNARARLAGADETTLEDGRALFMAKLALLLSGLCALVVIAGTLVLITLRPSD